MLRAFVNCAMVLTEQTPPFLLFPIARGGTKSIAHLSIAPAPDWYQNDVVPTGFFGTVRYNFLEKSIVYRKLDHLLGMLWMLIRIRHNDADPTGSSSSDSDPQNHCL